jgi:DNA-binding protein
MDKYKRVPKEKVDQDSIKDNEIRVVATSQRSARNYISYSMNLLTAEGEKAQSTIVLRAMGRAINKTINICEIIKRRVPGLHQLTKLESNTLVDNFEPLVQGLDPKEITRTVSAISITLSKEPLDTTDPGYQPPLDESEVQTEQDARAKRQAAQKEAAEAEGGDGEGKGKGKGRGRGKGAAKGKGRGKGKGAPGKGKAGKGKGKGGYDDGYDYGKGKGGKGDYGKGKGKGKGGGKGKGKGGRGGYGY